MKLKIITGNNLEELENRVNDFFKENAGIVLTNVEYKERGFSTMYGKERWCGEILIFYKER